jgi:NAD(P)-dependent dehydrogenase (short-subunit alcohol dehydrogenase family)
MTTNEKQLGKLDGKVALITGGNSGIGLATAKRFVNGGAYDFIAGRRQSELDAAAKEMGKNVSAVRGDVANLDDLDRLFAQIKKGKGQARYLVRQRWNRQIRAAWHEHRRVV